MALKKLQADLKEMSVNPPPLCSAGPIGNDMYKWQAIIVGPRDTPYQDGLFKLNIEFSSNYPFKPPTVKFETKIYHPNVHSSGLVCLDVLKDEWSPAMNVSTILLAIIALMNSPNPESAYSSEIADLYKKNRPAYDSRAKEWTRQYATS